MVLQTCVSPVVSILERLVAVQRDPLHGLLPLHSHEATDSLPNVNSLSYNTGFVYNLGGLQTSMIANYS
jgi:hypothetical protein